MGGRGGGGGGDEEVEVGIWCLTCCPWGLSTGAGLAARERKCGGGGCVYVCLCLCVCVYMCTCVFVGQGVARASAGATLASQNCDPFQGSAVELTLWLHPPYKRHLRQSQPHRQHGGVHLRCHLIYRAGRLFFFSQ